MERPAHTIEAIVDKIPTLYTAQEAAARFRELTAERLCELAETGYAPHYRIDRGQPLFNMTELKSWVVANLVSRQPGRAIPFNVATVVLPPISDPYEPPIPIRYIRDLRTLNNYTIPPGVYFLCLGDEVVYVGQSIRPLARTTQHDDKTFDRIYLLPVPVSDLNRVEGAFIRVLRPKLNGVGPVITPDLAQEVVASFSQRGEQ